MVKLRFKDKINIGFGFSLLIYVVAVLLVSIFTLRRSFEKVYERELVNMTESIYQVANASYLSTQEMLNNDINVLKYFVDGKAYVDSGSLITLEIENQLNGEKQQRKAPLMFVENNLGISKKVSFNDELVAYITRQIGATVTIFQRIDEGLLRISTSVQRSDSTYATGTYIPLNSPVSQAILAGESYHGRAYVVDDYYITAYRPLYEGSKLIGAYYVGVKQSNLGMLNQLIKSFRLGETYFPYVLATNGDIVIHPFIEKGNIMSAKDLEGRFFIREMIEEILRHKKSSGNITYKWKHERSGEPVTRLIYYKYFPQMQWVIAVGIDKNVIYAPLYKQIITTIIVSLAIFLLVMISVLLMGRVFTNQLQLLTEGIEAFSKKNFDARVKIKSEDELGLMAKTFNKMAGQLKSFYTELEDKVRERTEKISEINRHLLSQKKELEESHEEMAATNEELQTLNEALAESESKFRRLVENLREEYIFYSQNPDGTYQYISPSVENVLGYPVQEAVKGLTRYVTDSEMNEAAIQKVKEGLQGRRQRVFMLELYDVNGNKRVLEATETPVFDKQGE
ncbi:MAG: Cache 3/Cache 2 fusion domain-containing protein [Bacteroidota bacterium]|nr:Cache 3/Cache 2 fusion domain-containing protein [Bacteroidota bacterium]